MSANFTGESERGQSDFAGRFFWKGHGLSRKLANSLMEGLWWIVYSAR